MQYTSPLNLALISAWFQLVGGIKSVTHCGVVTSNLLGYLFIMAFSSSIFKSAVVCRVLASSYTVSYNDVYEMRSPQQLHKRTVLTQLDLLLVALCNVLLFQLQGRLDLHCCGRRHHLSPYLFKVVGITHRPSLSGTHQQRFSSTAWYAGQCAWVAAGLLSSSNW